MGERGLRTLFRRENLLFTLTSLWFILAAIGHTTAIFNELPDHEPLNAAVDAMRNATLGGEGSESPNLVRVIAALWVQVGLLMLGMAFINLAAVGASGGDKGVKTAVLIANLVVCVPLTALFVVVVIPPPLIVFGVASVLFGVDLVLTRRRV